MVLCFPGLREGIGAQFCLLFDVEILGPLFLLRSFGKQEGKDPIHFRRLRGNGSRG